MKLTLFCRVTVTFPVSSPPKSSLNSLSGFLCLLEGRDHLTAPQISAFLQKASWRMLCTFFCNRFSSSPTSVLIWALLGPKQAHLLRVLGQRVLSRAMSTQMACSPPPLTPGAEPSHTCHLISPPLLSQKGPSICLLPLHHPQGPLATGKGSITNQLPATFSVPIGLLSKEASPLVQTPEQTK